MKLALVGLGAVHRWHSDALRRVAEISVVAAFDVDRSKQPLLDGVPRMGSLPELLDVRPDAVLVAVPTPDHERVAETILGAGIDVILEKPATLDRAGLDRLYGIAEVRGVSLQVAFHDAYGPEVAYVRSRLRTRFESSHGPVRSIRSRFTDPYLARGAARERLRSLHGSWHDSGVNALSVVCSLEHGFMLESCRMEDLPGLGDRSTVATYRSTRPVGPWLAVETDWTTDRKEKTTRLEFDDAVAILDHRARTVRLDGKGGTTDLFRAESDLPRMTQQYLRFFRDLPDSGAAADANRRFSLEVHGLLFDAVEWASA